MNTFISLNDFKNFTQNNAAQPQGTEKYVLPLKNVRNLQINTSAINDKFQSAKKQNGLVEKLADKVKNVTKIGFGSAKIEQSIADFNSGKKTQQEVEADIKNYRRSQENVAQSFGDLASIALAGLAFFALHKNLTKGKSIVQLKEDKIKGAMQKFAERLENFKGNEQLKKILLKFQDKKNQDKLYDILSDRKTVNVLAALPAMIVGGFVKSNVLKLNRIGTSQYKAEYDKEKMSKEEIKQIKKANKKAKKNANFRNNLSGAINGLTMPIVGMLGPAGVPLYLAVNSLSKYFIASGEDKGEKSPASFVENLGSSKLVNAMTAALIAVPLIKNGKFTRVLEENAQKVVDELKNVKLSSKLSSKGSYDELEQILFSNPKIGAIMEGELKDTDKIRLLGEENIFALKFKQISNDGSGLTKALREKCPQTWTLQDAQREVEKTFGENTYKLRQCVGSGTVAQTFVAEDKNGRKVCIKMIHKGMSKDKILKDKEAFISMINASGKTQQEKDYLIKNIENISRGIEAEVNLQNEMDAAKRLAETVKKANVVKPIEVKDNIYVMERAEGISLADFNEFGDKISRARWDVEFYEKFANDGSAYSYVSQAELARYKKELADLIAEFKAKVGIDIEFEDLTKDETLKMLRQYQDILTEQFSKVDVQGKVIHGDIHPGNIFIDVKKLKEGKNCFTLIDTGNVIEQTREQAIRFMNLTNYVKNADVDNIVDFVLDGATLPNGMTRQKAAELLSAELRKAFFDKQTGIPVLTNDTLLTMTENILQGLNIIPSSVQGNLLKAKKSSSNSLIELYKSYLTKFESQFDKSGDLSPAQRLAFIAKVTAELTKDITGLKTRNAIHSMMQERSNLLKLPLTERIKLKKGLNVPDANSKDALTYFLKQYSSEDFDVKNFVAEFSKAYM